MELVLVFDVFICCIFRTNHWLKVKVRNLLVDSKKDFWTIPNQKGENLHLYQSLEKKMISLLLSPRIQSKKTKEWRYQKYRKQWNQMYQVWKTKVIRSNQNYNLLCCQGISIFIISSWVFKTVTTKKNSSTKKSQVQRSEYKYDL